MVYNKFLWGALSGIAVTATGFYLYQRNRDKVDAFLRNQGINIPAGGAGDFANMKMEELVTTKERLEDLIAEMEFAQKQAKEGA